MNPRKPRYIWERPDWPKLVYDSRELEKLLSEDAYASGLFFGRIGQLGMADRTAAAAEILTEEALTTSEIEGELFRRDSVRSSVARRLGLPDAGMAPEDRRAQGVVDVLLDATREHDAPLSAARLFGWHKAMFPLGTSGLKKITVGSWRDDRLGPMQVMSGPLGREKVHFEAPPAARVPGEMDAFFRWWAQSRAVMAGVVRAGMAHLWFVTIHPFDDGNGRLARTLSDMALAQHEGQGVRYYSVSSQIMRTRQAYYEVLERTQKGDGDVTEWLCWFIDCHLKSLARSGQILDAVFARAKFWQAHGQTPLSERQRKVVTKLAEAGPGGFTGGLSNRKYVAMTGASRATAFREIEDLLHKGVLTRREGGGRTTSYDLAWEG